MPNTERHVPSKIRCRSRNVSIGARPEMGWGVQQAAEREECRGGGRAGRLVAMSLSERGERRVRTQVVVEVVMRGGSKPGPETTATSRQRASLKHGEAAATSQHRCHPPTTGSPPIYELWIPPLRTTAEYSVLLAISAAGLAVTAASAARAPPSCGRGWEAEQEPRITPPNAAQAFHANHASADRRFPDQSCSHHVQLRTDRGLRPSAASFVHNP
ncbi:hypothetical protein K402DRAFT_456268 [Aulographum hederae CBS 113979]|uniref:Uncharacterized protein n=1 Tax=Aulographum hederae CBS 113979 TaxID=1176131 RepID=A0A6G1GS62_9PEZI|nr:hypothetical protein K402DRAFT_456268 [Aulographum hederae CBS 113979]